MDPYTQKTKIWLDERFKKCDSSGIYYAHQPIYGFRKEPSEPCHISRYIRTYYIMRALAHLKFDSLLDVGGAEGYQAYVAQQLFDCQVESSDLSEEACKRTEEIFGIKSTPIDIHALPFQNDAFDVLFCSETLEHVVDVDKAVHELLRVASKAVVITVPCESKETVTKNIKEQKSHAHIHNFNLKSFHYLESQGYAVRAKKLMSSLLFIPSVVIGAMEMEYNTGIKCPKFLLEAYNAIVPVLRKIFGQKAVVSFIRLDEFISNLTSCKTLMFIILKNKQCWRKTEFKKISLYKMMDIKVSYHYLQSNNATSI